MDTGNLLFVRSKYEKSCSIFKNIVVEIEVV